MLPFTLGLSWQYSAPRTALLCAPNYHAWSGCAGPIPSLCFICVTGSSSSLEGAGERSWGQVQGWGKKSWFRVSLESKQELKDLGPHSRATIAPCYCLPVPCLLLTSGLQKPDLYSAQHFSPCHYKDKGDKRFLSQCSELI